MTGNDIWPRNTRNLALRPTLGRSAEHVSCSTREDCPRLSLLHPQLGVRDTYLTIFGVKNCGRQVEEGNSSNSPRKAWDASKIDVDDKGKDYIEKILNMLFHEKISLQGPEKVERNARNLWVATVFEWYRLILLPLSDHITYVQVFFSI